MSYQRLFIHAIADILLVGDWQPQLMIKRVFWLLQAEPHWVVYLVDKLYSEFYADFPHVTRQKIAEFIANDQKFLEICAQQRAHQRIRRYNLQQIPSPPAKLNCEIPALHKTKDLSDWLGLSFGQLENYAANWRVTNQSIQTPHRHYHYHWVKKQGGQLRLIEAPKPRMAATQRQIYLGILNHIPLHQLCHGFRKKHSCKTYVAPHAGKKVVIHMDLENFFVSIPLRRIHALFSSIGYSETIAQRLAGLCCHQTPIDILDNNSQLTWYQRKQLMTPHLPQGSSSSPMLANLCTYKLDLRLAALAKKLGADYTRYADDLAFSGNSSFERFARHLPILVSHIAITEGFSVNHRKTGLMRQGVCQRLTGMTLNCFPNYPRKDYDQLKAILFNCVQSGPKSQNRKNIPDFKAHLQGKI